MTHSDQFICLILGHFDNMEQFKEMQANGKMDYPYAGHVNAACNDKIKKHLKISKDYFGRRKLKYS